MQMIFRKVAWTVDCFQVGKSTDSGGFEPTIFTFKHHDLIRLTTAGDGTQNIRLLVSA